VLALVRGRATTEQPSPIAAFIARRPLRAGVPVVAIGLAVIAGVSAPTPLQVIIVAVLVLVGILLIELVGHGTPSQSDTVT
jgi:hypothetical protein